jgi:hypothetical protein
MTTSTVDHLTQRLLVGGRDAVEGRSSEGIVASAPGALTLTRRPFARWIEPAHQAEGGPTLEAA